MTCILFGELLMEENTIEAQYPLEFRKDDALELGKRLKNHNSVVLIGMKRVGISNFLRFFLHHKDIVSSYIANGNSYLFIPIDLNDLVEREIFPFWRLTLKRILDSVEKSLLDAKVKKDIEELFVDSIQSQDLFLTIDNVRRSIRKLVAYQVVPTLFFLRFDRIKDAVTPEFFSNLQGLRDAANHQLSYVFTSFRSLDKLSPEVFTKASLSVFAQNLFIKPANREDMRSIYKTYQNRYHIPLTKTVEEALFEMVDGYVQYLQLALIALHGKKSPVSTREDLFAFLTKDEQIILQSEELWESLEKDEQMVISKVSAGAQVTESEMLKAKYLWDTGFINRVNDKEMVFSPLFTHYIKSKESKLKGEGNGIEFSKKEHLLFTLLQKKLNEICEREQIIEGVWPEVEALGVSDWAIDRLVARVRSKLKLQKSPMEIQTIKTRGYKLVQS